MDFGLDDKTTELHEQLLDLHGRADRARPSRSSTSSSAALDDRWAWSEAPVLKELQAEARELGLWNLFLPGEHADSPGLTNLQYAPLAEITGRSRPPRARRAQLRGARHRQHGGALAVRHARAEGALAQAAAGGRDPLVVRDDRAGRRLLRRDQHRDPDRARRRRVRPQRPQVVDHRRDEPARRDLHRDGQDRPVGVAAPPAEPGPGAARHPRPRGRPRHGGLRLRRPRARRPRRAALHRRPRPGHQPDRRGGRRLRDRPGPPGSWPHPPLHARDRRRRGARSS